jgi:hypothetical protein
MKGRQKGVDLMIHILRGHHRMRLPIVDLHRSVSPEIINIFPRSFKEGRAFGFHGWGKKRVIFTPLLPCLKIELPRGAESGMMPVINPYGGNVLGAKSPGGKFPSKVTMEDSNILPDGTMQGEVEPPRAASGRELRCKTMVFTLNPGNIVGYHDDMTQEAKKALVWGDAFRRLVAWAGNETEVAYMKVAQERGSDEDGPGSGNYHLQGVVQWRNKKSLSGARSFFHRKCPIIKTTFWSRKAYSNKAKVYPGDTNKPGWVGRVWEHGTWSPIVTQGARTDLAAFGRAVEAGAFQSIADLYRGPNASQFDSVVAKYTTWAEKRVMYGAPDPREPIKATVQQGRVVGSVLRDVHSKRGRAVHYVWSKESGTGKSAVGQLLEQEERICTIPVGSSSTMVVTLYNNERIVVVDCSRSSLMTTRTKKVQTVNGEEKDCDHYGNCIRCRSKTVDTVDSEACRKLGSLLELLSDRSRLASPKYHGKVVYMMAVVVVITNLSPEESRMEEHIPGRCTYHQMFTREAEPHLWEEDRPMEPVVVEDEEEANQRRPPPEFPPGLPRREDQEEEEVSDDDTVVLPPPTISLLEPNHYDPGLLESFIEEDLEYEGYSTPRRARLYEQIEAECDDDDD